MSPFAQKDPSEKVPLTFDFTNGLDAGETLTGTPTVTVACTVGTDATPQAILNGSATLIASATKVLQAVQGGLAGCDYLIKVVTATSNAQKVLALSAVLPVRS